MKPRTFRALACALSLAFGGLAGRARAEDPAPDGWKNESQAGVVLTSGNTETSTYSLKQDTAYKFGDNLAKIFAAYLYQESGDVVSGKQWTLGVRYERILSERLSVFVGQTVEGNRFSGIDQRYFTDAGAKYYLEKEENLYWFAELGYRYTRENLTLVTNKLHYARAYTEIEKKFSPTVSAKYWVEYLPNFTQSKNWQLNTELSLSAALNSIFSVKSAYLVRYDNEINAPGLKKTDTTLTTALVAKF